MKNIPSAILALLTFSCALTNLALAGPGQSTGGGNKIGDLEFSSYLYNLDKSGPTALLKKEFSADVAKDISEKMSKVDFYLVPMPLTIDSAKDGVKVSAMWNTKEVFFDNGEYSKLSDESKSVAAIWYSLLAKSQNPELQKRMRNFEKFSLPGLQSHQSKIDELRLAILKRVLEPKAPETESGDTAAPAAHISRTVPQNEAPEAAPVEQENNRDEGSASFDAQ